MIVFALAVALGTLGVGVIAALALRRLPSLRLQLAGLGLLAVALPLAAVLVSGLVMFDSGHDLTILLVAAACSTAALAAAGLLGGSIMRSLDRLRSASAAVAGGDLGARAPEDGPAELAELGVSFNEMAASVEELFDARRQLVAWASHDLRTPLASMKAMLEAVEDGLVEPERYIAALKQQVDALGLLVDDLFELARLDAGILSLELREAPLAGVVRSALGGLQAEAEARRVALAAHIDGNPTAICAPEKVERVLLNLLTNAIRHTPSDGAVAVTVEPLEREVRVSVEDGGEGIPADSTRRIFDHFWRGDRSRTSETGGAGLGLAIAHGLVEAQGGRIWAENVTGGGARVSFTLPRR